jgi:hypothetical protein
MTEPAPDWVHAPALIMRLLLALITILGFGSPACAHLMPNSVISLDFHKSAVEAEILMPMSELAYGSGHRLALASVHGMGSEAPFIAGYVRQHLSVQSPDGRPWIVAVGASDISSDSWNTDIRTAVTLTPPPGGSTRKFTLAWDGIIDRVSNHFVLVFVRSDFAMGTMASAPEMLGGLQGSTRRLTVDRGTGNSWLGFLASLRLGMEHIAEGHDHLLFLMALILPAPLVARGGRWTNYGGWRRMARKLAIIVSAFTIGHSLTLIGGAVFDWQLPARPLDPGFGDARLAAAVRWTRSGGRGWLRAGSRTSLCHSDQQFSLGTAGQGPIDPRF